MNHTEPFHRLDHKLHSTAMVLRKWSNSIISDTKLKLQMAEVVILHLNAAQDIRSLSHAEFALRAKLKKRILGWAVIERARKRQSSRIKNLQERDANIKYFHLKVNAHKRKNFIQRLRTDTSWDLSHQDKQDIVHDQISNIMTTPKQRT